MLLVPNDVGRRGARTTEFWICAAAEAALAAACLTSGGAKAACAGAGAAAVAVGYCACRTALKSRMSRAWKADQT
jgi:hypothetical protein